MVRWRSPVGRVMVGTSILLAGLGGIGSTTYAAPPPLSASSAILVDGQTGQILYGRKIMKEYYPASITKIMTAYLAITHGWNKAVVVSQQAQDQIGASAYLRAGERDPMPKVVTAMMLVSGNDAAYAVAQTVSGSVPAFVRLMNQQAQAWKAPGIHFANPDGLPNPKHVVTALGMAIITEHAMKNPIFASIVRTHRSTLPPDPNPRVYYNQNQLLYDYRGAVGVKIGYTTEADETIVGAARRQGMFLIEVLLHDTPTGLWPDSKNLLSWGFQHFRPVTLIQSGEAMGNLVMGHRLIPVKAGDSLPYLVENGALQRPSYRLEAFHPQDAKRVPGSHIIGRAVVFVGGHQAGTVPLVSRGQVLPLAPPIHWQWLWLLFPAAAVAPMARRPRRMRAQEGR